MKKSRSRKYNKRGGDATIPSSNTGSTGGIMGWMSNAWNSTKKNSQGLFSKLSESTSNMMNKAKSSLDSPVSSYSPSPSPSPSPTTTTTTSTTSYTPSTSIQGGRKKRGGKSIAYDAAPVDHSNVANPTYWIGGKSRRNKRKSKSTRRNRKHRK